jgi:hypothetical protein
MDPPFSPHFLLYSNENNWVLTSLYTQKKFLEYLEKGKNEDINFPHQLVAYINDLLLWVRRVRGGQ